MSAPRAEEDPGLVTRARAGDAAALEQLLRQQQPQVYAVCRRITGNEADGLDATQEALISLVRGLPNFDGQSRLSTWVYRIATNAALDELRRRSRRPLAVLGADTGRRPRAESTTADHASTVADRLEVDEALATLSEEFRTVIVLRDLCQLDYAEIAEVLDLPPGTVRSRIARARGQLADHIRRNQTTPLRRQTPST